MNFQVKAMENINFKYEYEYKVHPYTDNESFNFGLKKIKINKIIFIKRPINKMKSRHDHFEF